MVMLGIGLAITGATVANTGDDPVSAAMATETDDEGKPDE